MEHLTQAILGLVESIGVFGYWVAFVAALAETVLVVGLIMPGSSFLLLMGVLAGQGALDLGDLLVFAIAGAVLGDNINFWLGRHYGHRWLGQGRWFLKAEYLSKAEGFFEHHGGKSVCLGRFVPSVKELMPFIAGMAQMERWPFFFWNLLGAIGWALQWILPGYIFSQSMALAHAWLSRIGLALFLFVALVALLYLLRWLAIRYGRNGLKRVRSTARSIGAAIRDNPGVSAWSRRHPRLITFLTHRVETTRMRGLPTTLASLSLLYALLLFGGLVDDLLTQEAVVTADARINNLIAGFRSPVFNHLFYGLSTLASPWVVLAGLLVGVALLYRMRRLRFVVPMFIASAFAAGFVLLSQQMLHRPGPEHGLLTPSNHSFPSGHAALSVALYGFLCFVFAHSASAWRTRINWFFGAVIIALLVGFSRLYLGAEHLSDVLAGYLLGGSGLLLGVALTYSGWRGPRLSSHGYRHAPTHGALALVPIGALWLAALLAPNLNPPLLTASSAPVEQSQTYDGPQQLFPKQAPEYALSVAGERKSPINMMLITSPKTLESCLRAADWHPADETRWQTVLAAYRDVMMHRGNPTAPLSPWFWRDRTPWQQWSRIDGPDQVFNRSFLRIWQTPYKTGSGENVLVASTGHESLPSGHLIPRPDANFAVASKQLVDSLRSAGGVAGANTLNLTAERVQASNRLAYDGKFSIVRLKECQ